MNIENTYYLLCNILCLVGPLALSFDKKVRFVQWLKPCFLAIFTVGFLFIVWDIWFTSRGIWGFNPRYLLGIQIINLPVEEILFFVAIPYAGLFTYECIRVYLNYNFNKWLIKLLIVFILSWTIPIAYIHSNDWYTFSASGVMSLSLVIFLIRTPKWFSNFLVMYWTILIPFFFSNGFLTGYFTNEPIVWYNNLESQGIRIGSIPFEDFLYGFSLLLWNVWFFEFYRFRFFKKA